MSVYNERLQLLGERAAQLFDEAEDLDESTRELAELVFLAAYFDYQVKNGGFGQLIHNLGGDHLERCDGMLSAVGAPIALSFYFRAVTRCAQDLEDYNTFMADFTAPTELRDDLAMITFEYFRADTSFDDEIVGFLDVAEAGL
ncbi:DMP19 family protein [Nocardia tengchongensis]|uniref:DMP19 family protein n=1 Tax=Nocardia tengchongensis TaxID=2055889 RepID=UPI0036A7750D